MQNTLVWQTSLQPWGLCRIQEVQLWQDVTTPAKGTGNGTEMSCDEDEGSEEEEEKNSGISSYKTENP